MAMKNNLITCFLAKFKKGLSLNIGSGTSSLVIVRVLLFILESKQRVLLTGIRVIDRFRKSTPISEQLRQAKLANLDQWTSNLTGF